MDADIEMTDTNDRRYRRTPRVGDTEVTAAENLEDVSTYYNKYVNGQNTAFMACFLLFLMCFAAYLVTKVYLTPDEFSPSLSTETVGELETITNDNTVFASEGTLDKDQVAQSLSKVKHHSTIDSLIKEHTGRTGPSDTIVEKQKLLEIKKWLRANVTLQDGKKWEIVGDPLEHDPTAFLEGLTYANGKLYESTGLNGLSDIRVLDPDTGAVLEKHPIPSKYFGEGLTYANDRLIQLTYKAKTGFIYNASDLNQPPTTFNFDCTTGEGWGLTYDHHHNELIESDGSEYLHFWDPNTFKEIRKLKVTRQSGKPAKQINELEYWRGRVVANIWYEDSIIVINPQTGAVEKEYDFSELYAKADRSKDHADVLNGISKSADPNVLYVTGCSIEAIANVTQSKAATFIDMFLS